MHGGLLLVQLAFATHYVTSKIIIRDLSPAALTFGRAVAATVVLMGLHFARAGAPRVPLSDLAKLAGCALLGVSGNQLLFFMGLRHTTAINASVLTTTIPVFTLIVSTLLRREQVTLRGGLGVVVALSGVLTLVGAEALTLGLETMAGDLLILANSLFYGAYMVLVANLVKRHGTLTCVAWLFFFGALWMAPFGAEDLVRSAPALTATVWALVAYTVLVPTILAYVLNAWALRHAPTSIVAIYIYLQPLGAAVLAVLLLGEVVTLRLAFAAALVFVGIGLVTLRRPVVSGEASGGSRSTE